ncbi:MAG: ankyrin repeat domain-containing protein [Gemmatimonadaceae bacterium]|jgi:ankyrin repeat protein|nr:ankyrin repeat domain-containing protein [Gemmatimonadaceae bacterium]
MPIPPSVVDAFLRAASVPRTGSHTSGSLHDADAIVARHPTLAEESLHAAAALGDADAVERHLRSGRVGVREGAPPYGWDALTHLCFSRYLRLAPERASAFTVAAERLLTAGADPNAGWPDDSHGPTPVIERVLYGAAGVAQHVGVTRALLAAGADPNDEETPYHVPESYELAALTALLESGRCTSDTLVTMLLRKADWHDHDGVQLLLAHGADPNGNSRWGWTPLAQAIRRDNAMETIDLMLDHGGDPGRGGHGHSALLLAAAQGRDDVLTSMARRGTVLPAEGAVGLVVACAMDNAAQVEALRASGPALLAQGAALIGAFASVGNARGLAHLVALGVAVDTPLPGDGYWQIAPGATALHVAAWRHRPATVDTLLAYGANVHVRDARGRSVLMEAVRGCVASYWTERASPALVARLLAAGASASDVTRPTGSDAIDALLAAATT